MTSRIVIEALPAKVRLPRPMVCPSAAFDVIGRVGMMLRRTRAAVPVENFWDAVRPLGRIFVGPDLERMLLAGVGWDALAEMQVEFGDEVTDRVPHPPREAPNDAGHERLLVSLGPVPALGLPPVFPGGTLTGRQVPSRRCPPQSSSDGPPDRSDP